VESLHHGQQNFRTFSNADSQANFALATSSVVADLLRGGVGRIKNAVAKFDATAWSVLRKKLRYCNVSIKRVMVRFKSLSDRRISSILLIECSTVV